MIKSNQKYAKNFQKCQNYSKYHSQIFAGKNEKLPANNFCRQFAGKAHVYLQHMINCWWFKLRSENNRTDLQANTQEQAMSSALSQCCVSMCALVACVVSLTLLSLPILYLALLYKLVVIWSQLEGNIYIRITFKAMFFTEFENGALFFTSA